MGSAGSPTRGCNCQRGACIIQEAGLGYKNDEKKDGLPDLWPFFSPSGSLSCSFTTHQTLLCLLDTGAPVQSCIVVFCVSPGRLLKEVALKTGAFWPVITHICKHTHTLWFSLSLQSSCPLICRIITKQRSFYVGECEAALLVSFYLSAAWVCRLLSQEERRKALKHVFDSQFDDWWHILSGFTLGCRCIHCKHTHTHLSQSFVGSCGAP